MTSVEFEVSKLPISRLPRLGILGFIGDTNSGKTVTIFNILRHYKDTAEVVIVMCGSKSTVALYKERIPGSFVHYVARWDKKASSLLSMYFSKMESINENITDENKKIQMILILDDLSYHKGIIRDETLIRIAKNGRHSGILCFFAAQYSKDLPPSLRTQMKMVFCNYDKKPKNRRRLYEAFDGACFSNPDEFDKIFVSCTKKRGEVFVIDNQWSNSTNPCDSVYFYKTKFPVPKYKMLENSAAWRLDEQIKRERKTTFSSSRPPTNKKEIIVSKINRKRKREDT
jgi:hypothetical protein